MKKVLLSLVAGASLLSASLAAAADSVESVNNASELENSSTTSTPAASLSVATEDQAVNSSSQMKR